MAWSEATSGSTLTDGTEQTLATRTSGKTAMLGIDLNVMVAADILEVRLYTKVLAGSTSRTVWSATYANVQSPVNQYSVPIPAVHEWKATIKRTAGADHTYDWSVLEAP